MWCPFSSGQGYMDPIGYLVGWALFIWFIVFTILVVAKLDGILKALNKKNQYQEGTMNYYYNKSLRLSFEEAISKVTDGLKKEGFGVITEINLHEKFKEKLNVDFRKYKILGACNPALAYEALQAENNIGVMLPCNIVVQEAGSGKVEVAVINPVASMGSVNNPRLLNIAQQVRDKLKKIIDTL